ncbi:MAG: hypothetical protein M3P48_05160, partial [Actinomycetota bacterium]|nr:hypothetical protein [Actinomycetota bacterium]
MGLHLRCRLPAGDAPATVVNRGVDDLPGDCAYVMALHLSAFISGPFGPRRDPTLGLARPMLKRVADVIAVER